MLRYTFIILVFACSSMCGYCQSTIADSIAVKVADRMKDSLQLTNIERMNILKVNRSLLVQKQLAFKTFDNVDSLRRKVQAIENTRDSLYQVALPDVKFELYQQKKRFLINSQ